MKSKKLLVALLFCSILLSACGRQTEDVLTPAETIPETETQITESEVLTELESETETIAESESQTEIITQEGTAVSDVFKKNQLNVAVRLLQEEVAQHEQENVMISPLSISTALGMTANGADGQTHQQMESFLNQELNSFNADLKAYTDSLTSSKFSKCVSANSIWIRQSDNITVNEDFLKTADEVYQAGAFEEPFTPDTKDKINNWVSEHTDNMIDEIIKEINPDSMMYLINALTFDAQWSDQYEYYQVQDETFTALNGTERTVSMMHSTENTYYKDDSAVGFGKSYKGGYEFIALLPNEEIDFQEYINSLDCEKLQNLLENPSHAYDVDAKLPAFESEFSTSLKASLSKSMPDAFSPEKADFSKMAELTNPAEKLVIDDVFHKTYISVDKNGTKAAAVTAVSMYSTCCEEEKKSKKFTSIARLYT